MDSTQVQPSTTETFSGLSENRQLKRVMLLDRIDPGDVFFQKILRLGMCDDTIQDVQLVEKRAAVKKGDNYLSYLTRFTLKYICNVPKGLYHEVEHNVAHLIIKEEPDSNGMTLEYVRETNIFDTERLMLEEIVPKIEKLIGKRLSPKAYYSSNEPNIIVMEDLVSLGFQNKNRKVGLNKKQMFMILENIADFHAASVLLNEQNPGCVSRFASGFINSKTPVAFFTFISNGLESIGNSVRNWPGEKFVSISNKLINKSREIIQKLFIVYQCDADELQVLNHGDLWVNNIMFKDDGNGEPQEVRFVDYQMCIWSSPAIDLLYFLGIVPETSIKMTNDEIFLQCYLNRFASTMQTLGCCAKSPTLEQLKRSMFKRRDYTLMAALTFYPKMIADDDEVEDVDDILERGESTTDLLKNPTARETIAKILPILDERGYLD
ncbi:uncharacterized protein LOC107047743 [Diachasma alloeum]|uniref:uncharacterized protein LOC107047743 n=1 Tax=Diachasma alloeum TaxID=454923 RepID=UPI0007381038|nr:uncharacterized protein LOC107047743 [Diachasma alloeum]